MGQVRGPEGVAVYPVVSAETIETLERLAAISDPDEREAFVWQHPCLLEPGALEATRVAIAAAGRTDAAALDAALESAVTVRTWYEESGSRFPIGAGPLEQVWKELNAGEVSRADCDTLVRSPEFLAALGPAYLRDMCAFVSSAATNGEWAQALDMQHFVVTAVEALPDTTDNEALRREATIAWLLCVQFLLVDHPNPRLLREAAARGDQVLARATAATDPLLQGRLLFRLGVVYLDPYTAFHSPHDYEQSILRWCQKASDDDWADPDAQDGRAELLEPLVAVERAEGYLRRALPLAAGDRRGETLKALAQAIEWRGRLGSTIDEQELERIQAEALELLKEDRGLLPRLQILAKQARAGGPVDLQEVAPVLERSPDELVASFGRAAAVELIDATLVLLGHADPRRGLELVRSAAALYATAPESVRAEALRKELRLLIAGYAPGSRLDAPPDAAAIRSLAGAGSWDEQATGAVVVDVAMRQSLGDNELLGLGLLDALPDLSPRVAVEHESALSLLRADLLVGAAVNALNAGDWATAAATYAEAVQPFLAAGLATSAFDVMARLLDVVLSSRQPLMQEILAALLPNVRALATQLGNRADELIQDLARAVLANGSGQPLNPVALHYLWQVAKGARLAPVLGYGSSYVPAEDPHAQQVLQSIDAEERLRVEETATESGDVGSLLDEEFVLNAYIGVPRPAAGTSSAVRLANLQVQYDEHISRELLRGAEGDMPLLRFEAMSQLIGPRTVLVNMFLGPAADGDMAVYVLYIAGEDMRVSVIGHGFPSATVSVEGVEAHPLAFLVARVRRAVQEAPLGRATVSKEAVELLEDMLPGLLGHVSERLAEFKASGRDHLCIVPHGAFHYFPFHLLGRPGHPLAEDFAVSYLPHLHLLTGGWNRESRSQGLSAYGLGFGSDPRPGLGPLREAVSEAQAIAEVFGTTALVEDDATEMAIAQGLTSSRYVHIATHGRHNVHAPAFQCLYCAPSPGSDGRLFSHEIVGLDLRGVRLLTLSACETALGRFDLGDNIRGLPASFFAAGVTTLVGTLWPVDDEASKHFFVTFYRQVHAGASLLDAFVDAQRDTRAVFPQYRHWGAFYFAGDWMDRGPVNGGVA